MVGLAFGHARGNRAHTDLGHQLDADVGMRRHVFQVVNELGQIFNRINVMVRWRRNQAHAGHRVPQFADVLGHLAAGQLPALARLGALGHLDLDLVSAAQVFSGDAKTAGSDLLDLGPHGVAPVEGVIHLKDLLAQEVRHGLALLDRDALELVAVTQRVFAAFAGVALAADAVHGDGQRRVRLGGDRPKRHGAGGKALDDFFGGFNFVYRNGFGRVDLELKQAAQGQVAAALVVDELGVLFVSAPVVGTRAVLQLGDRIRRPHMLFAPSAPGVFAARVQGVGQHRVGAEGCLVGADRFFCNLENADTLNAAGRAGEVLRHRLARQSNRLKQLRTAVAHVGAHAHFGHDLGQALAHRLDVVVDRFIRTQSAG